MAMDLFVGIPVRDYNAALAWYERLLGTPPSFLPNDTEAVWELADHRYVFIEVRHEDAGLTPSRRPALLVSPASLLWLLCSEISLCPSIGSPIVGGVLPAPPASRGDGGGAFAGAIV